jgi:hypothetical protein
MIVMFFCGSALEAQGAVPCAAANKKQSKRIAFKRATCDG